MIRELIFILAFSNFFWNKQEKIKIGLAWSGKEAEKVAKLALSDVNNIDLISFEDKGKVSEGLVNAQKFVEAKVSAVVGHKESYISIPAASVYEMNKIIMINPSSTSTELPRYAYILRTIPSDSAMGAACSEYFLKSHLKSVMICYADNSYGKSFANSFEKSCEGKGINVVDRCSYHVGDEREYKHILKKWENYKYDAIMFIGYEQAGINFIKLNNRRVPLVCSEGVLNDALLLLPESEGVVFPMLFNPEDHKGFVEIYEKEYGSKPTFDSAIIYDSLNILKNALLNNEGMTSLEIVEYIKKNKFYGLMSYEFDQFGNVITEQLSMQAVMNGQYKFIGKY